MQQYDFGSVADCQIRLARLFPDETLAPLREELALRLAGQHTPEEFVQVWELPSDDCPPPYELSSMEKTFIQSMCMNREFLSAVGILRGNYLLVDPDLLAWNLLRQPEVLGITLSISFGLLVSFLTAYLIRVAPAWLDYMPLWITLGAAVLIAMPIVKTIITFEHAVVAAALYGSNVLDLLIEILNRLVQPSEASKRRRREKWHLIQSLRKQPTPAYKKLKQLEMKVAISILFGAAMMGIMALLTWLMGVANSVIILAYLVGCIWLILFSVKVHLKEEKTLLERAKQELDGLAIERQ